MSDRERTPLAVWRDTLRDSSLDTTAKAVGFVIATYWNRDGRGAFPSKRTIARGAGLRSERPADRAVHRLETAGFLIVDRSRGRSSNRYVASLPTPSDATGYDGTGSNLNPVLSDIQPRPSKPLTPSPGTPESVESERESVTTATPSRYTGSKTKSNRSYTEYDR